jgi:hypothetical protein
MIAMQNNVSFLEKGRTFLSVLNRLIFLIFSSYYVINNKAFAVTLSPFIKNIFLQSFFSTLLTDIINSIEAFGMFFMILPCAIVLTSFLELHPFIRIISTILATGGNLFAIIHGISRGVFMTENFKIGPFFNIYNKVSFEEKLILFSQMFDQAVAKSLYIPSTLEKGLTESKFSLFVKDYVSKHSTEFQEPIKTTSVSDLQILANKTVAMLETKFKETALQVDTVPTVGWGGTVLKYAVFAALTAVALYFIYRFFFGGKPDPKEQAQITTDLAANATRSSHIQTTHIQTTQNSVAEIKNIITDTNETLTNAVSLTAHDVGELNIKVATLGIQNSELSTRLTQLENYIADLNPNNSTPSDMSRIYNTLTEVSQDIEILGKRDRNILNVATELKKDLDNITTLVTNIDRVLPGIIQQLDINTHILNDRLLRDENNNNNVDLNNNMNPSINNNNNNEELFNSLLENERRRIDITTHHLETQVNTLELKLNAKLSSLTVSAHTLTEAAERAILREKQSLADSIAKLNNIKDELHKELSSIEKAFKSRTNTISDNLNKSVQEQFQSLARRQHKLETHIEAKLKDFTPSIDVHQDISNMSVDLANLTDKHNNLFGRVLNNENNTYLEAAQQRQATENLRTEVQSLAVSLKVLSDYVKSTATVVSATSLPKPKPSNPPSGFISPSSSFFNKKS